MTCRTPTCPACDPGYVCQGTTGEPECTPNTAKGCYDNNVYNYDSCGTRGSLFQTCGTGYSCNSGNCVNSSNCGAIGDDCQANSACCSGLCELTESDLGTIKNPKYDGSCVAGNAGGSSSCAPGFQKSASEFNYGPCFENCVDHLDWDSYRKEGGVMVETSDGEPNVFNGVCLSLKGNIYNHETGESISDECRADATTVVKYVVDGCFWCDDRTVFKDYTCPFGCSDGACRTSSSCQAEAGTCNANGDCCEGYCGSGHCCAVGYKYLNGQCVGAAHCNEPTNLCPYKPSDAAFWDNPNDVRLCLAYGAVKPNTYEACCLTGNFGDPTLKEYLPITTY
jgi:hypothetical protein